MGIVIRMVYIFSTAIASHKHNMDPQGLDPDHVEMSLTTFRGKFMLHGLQQLSADAVEEPESSCRGGS
jgi:hypothetical protein